MSTTTTHTPGPWTLTNSGDIAFSASAGFAPSTWGNRSPLSEADARLIAAAPELLDALKTLVDNLHEAQEDTNADGEVYSDIQHARHIIAKATGDDQ